MIDILIRHVKCHIFAHPLWWNCFPESRKDKAAIIDGFSDRASS